MSGAAVLNKSAIDAPVSAYREWRPSPAWRQVVVCRWEQHVEGGHYVQRVLPDGYADIIVDRGGHALVAGPARHVSLPQLEPGTLRGLRLRTEAIGPVLGVAGSELADATFPLDAVVPAHRARTMAEALMAGDDDGLERLAHRWWPGAGIDGRVRAACAALRYDTAGTVDDVADSVPAVS